MKHLFVLFFCFLVSYSIIKIFSCRKSSTIRRTDFSVEGIDVSHYQSNILWEKIAEQGIDFVFVKASEGVSYQDSFFKKNWEDISKSNIIKGAYHFFYPSLDVKKQFENFASCVELKAGDLPPVLDIEMTNGLNKKNIEKAMRLWLRLAEKRYGVKPIIYTNLDFYTQYIQHYGFESYPLWIARYHSVIPSLPNNRQWFFWQYGDNGQLEGMQEPVDMNVFNGNIETLKALCLQPKEAEKK